MALLVRHGNAGAGARRGSQPRPTDRTVIVDVGFEVATDLPVLGIPPTNCGLRVLIVDGHPTSRRIFNAYVVVGNWSKRGGPRPLAGDALVAVLEAAAAGLSATRLSGGRGAGCCQSASCRVRPLTGVGDAGGAEAGALRPGPRGAGAKGRLRLRHGDV